MGLFDIFKKKNSDQSKDHAQASAKSPWASRLKNYRDWPDEKKKAETKAFLAELGTSLQNPKVKEKLDFDDVDLRGRFKDLPVKVEVDGTSGWVSVDAKCNVPFNDVSLDWDLEKIPVHADDDGADEDDWGDEEEIRVFLAKGVFSEGEKSEVNSVLADFATLPETLQSDILATIQKHKLSRFGIYGDGITIGFDDNLYEFDDPIADVCEVFDFCTRIAAITNAAKPAEGSNEPPVMEGAAAAVPLNLVSCSYCSTLFNLGSNSQCPNCGASYTG